MPPKKAENKEAYSSVEYNIKVLSVQYDLQKEEQIELVKDPKDEVMEIISRQDIIEQAREKGLYIDMNNLSEKEKNSKTFKADPSKTTLTSDIMASAFLLMMEDKELAVKKIKKDILDAKNKQKVDPKAKTKKDEPVQEVEEVPIEKEIPQLDKIFFLNDFPNLEELPKIKGIQIDCVILNKQEKQKDKEVDVSILEELHMSEEMLKKKLQRFIEEKEKEQKEGIDEKREDKLELLVEGMKEENVKLEVLTQQLESVEELGKQVVVLGKEFIDSSKQYEQFCRDTHPVPLLTQSHDISSIRQQWQHNYYYQTHSHAIHPANTLDNIIEALLYQIQMEQHPTQLHNIQEFDHQTDTQFINNLLVQYSPHHQQTKEQDIQSLLRRESDKYKYLAKLETFAGQHQIQNQERKEVQKVKAQEQIVQVGVGLEKEEFYQGEVLRRFEAMMGEKVKERQFDFSGRLWREDLNTRQMRERLHWLELEDMDMHYMYHGATAQLYLVLYSYNPPGRVLSRHFTYPHNLYPQLPLFRQHSSHYIATPTLYTLPGITEIKQKQQLMFPDDNSVIRMERSWTGEDYFQDKCSVRVEEGHTMGLKPKVFYFQFIEGLRLSLTYKEEQQAKLQIIDTELVISVNHRGEVEQQRVSEQNNRQPRKQHAQMVTRAQFTKPNSVERRRTIDCKGRVRKYMPDGTVEILTPNGQILENKKNGMWVITYREGERCQYNQKTKERRRLQPLETTVKYEIDEHKRVLVRKDGAAFTEDKKEGQGACLVSRFSDGTLIQKEEATGKVTISHPHYHQITLTYDQVKARMGTVIGEGSSFASIGYQNLMERSHTGLIIQTQLDHKGSYLQHYQEKQQLSGGKYQLQWVYLFYGHDQSLLKFTQQGQALYLGANTRTRLDHLDSFIQLFGLQEERKQGVYSADLGEDYLETRDSQNNHFRVSSNGNVIANVSVSLVQTQSNGGASAASKDMMVANGVYVDPINMFLPPPLTWIPPALFLLNSDSSGYQFHDQQAFNALQKSFQSLTYDNTFTKTQILYQKQQNEQQQQQYVDKQNLSKVIVPSQQTKVHQYDQAKNVIDYRQFTQFNPSVNTTQEQLTQFQIDHIVSQKLAKYSTITPSQAHQDQEFDIQMKIYEKRQKENIEF